jgi:hypothetical protein
MIGPKNDQRRQHQTKAEEPRASLGHRALSRFLGLGRRVGFAASRIRFSVVESPALVSRRARSRRRPFAGGDGRRRRSVGTAILCIAALLALGCSSFERDWESAIEERRAANWHDPVLGPWHGHWLSEKNGHTGELRCLIRRLESAETDGEAAPTTGPDPTSYIARYKARWGGIFKFEYELPVSIPPPLANDGTRRLTSEADLGWLWGSYAQTGEITGGRIRSKYQSDHDAGTFELVRPELAAEAP